MMIFYIKTGRQLSKKKKKINTPGYVFYLLQ